MFKWLTLSINNFFFDPLEQFDLIIFFSFLNNAVIWNFILLFFIFYVFYFLCLKKTDYYYLVNSSYKFIRNLVNSQIEDKSISIKFVPIFYFLFIFILISNIFGVIPFVYTTTSLIVLPFFLSITFFGYAMFVSVRKYKWNFFSIFLPSGVPIFIMPFLILIEFISYIMRIFSLAIRLFANMLSGHILIKILVSVAWFLLNSFLAIQTFFFFNFVFTSYFNIISRNCDMLFTSLCFCFFVFYVFKREFKIRFSLKLLLI